MRKRWNWDKRIQRSVSSIFSVDSWSNLAWAHMVKKHLFTTQLPCGIHCLKASNHSNARMFSKKRLNLTFLILSKSQRSTILFIINFWFQLQAGPVFIFLHILRWLFGRFILFSTKIGSNIFYCLCNFHGAFWSIVWLYGKFLNINV